MPQKIEVHTLGHSYKDAVHIIEDPVKEPGAGQIRIRNHYAGVNGLFDHMIMQGKVGYISLTPPIALGVEAVGVVEAVGPGADFKVGDPVATKDLGGAYRHQQIIAAENVYRVPAATPEYLAIVPTGISAQLVLTMTAQPTPGETVIISAAAGGLGHILVQLAANMGCRVIGIAGGDEKCAFVEQLGAERCINYKTAPIADVLAQDFKDAINVGVDTVGGPIFDAMVANVAPLGRIVSSGYASEIVDGAKPVLQTRIYEKLYWKGASVRGFMNALLAEHHRRAAAELFEMMAAGTLKVSIDPTVFKGLDSLPDAAAHMMSGKNIGKTVMDLRD